MNTKKPKTSAHVYDNVDDHRAWLSRLTRVEAWRYAVPLTCAIQTPQLTIRQREGILLRWNIAGRDIYSDLCPLPGFSQENLDGALVQLKAALIHPIDDLYSSVDLAIFSARFQSDHPEIQLLTERGTADIPQICCLLSPNEPIPTSGFSTSCIKIKIGQSTVEQDINRLQQVCDLLDSSQTIRLDANGQLNNQYLKHLFSKIDPLKIDYIEDPFNAINDYHDWANRYPVAFAWDDLSSHWHENLPENMQPKALVIKPLFLGLRRAWSIAQTAHSCHIQVVFSSAYESSLNNQLYIRLARLLGSVASQGLDTDKYWSSSLLTPPLIQEPLNVTEKTVLQLSDMDFQGIFR